MFRHEYISPEGLKGLDEYAYKSGTYSWLDMKMNPFWIACADLLPLWFAPNLVTLVGTFHLFLIFILTAYYDPLLEGQAPAWVYVVNGACVWIYQTMDAMDGKQARRTKSSSPLGQLFDHGCDALGSTFLVIGLASATCQGAQVGSLFLLAVLQVPFFLCQWEEYHVHTLRTQVGNFGVTEGQYLNAFLLILSGLAGTGIWHTQMGTLFPTPMVEGLAKVGALLPFMNDTTPAALSLAISTFEARHMLILTVSGFPIMVGIACLNGVLTRTKTWGERVGAFKQLIPIFIMEIALFLLIEYPGFKIVYTQHPLLISGMFGVLFTHLTNRIIIANMCKVKYSSRHAILLPLPFVFYAMARLHDETAMMAIFCGYGCLVLFQYFHFVVNVNTQICQHLGIETFRIKPVKKDE